MISRILSSAILLCTPGLGTPGLAQVFVNGSIVGDPYCAAVAVQTCNTEFGDNQSELNAGYGVITNGYLHLALTGNLEANFNKLDIFIDSMPGGENTLSGMPGNDGSYRMAGTTFDAGMDPDFLVIVRRGNNGTNDIFDLDIGRLGTSDFSSFGDVFGGSNVGYGSTGTGTVNSNPIHVGYNGSNTAGVVAGSGAANSMEASAVITGLELAIAVVDLGSPAGPVRVTAFVNGGDHNYASNQFLGGLPAPQGNLGGDGTGNFTGSLTINLNNYPGDQFFEVAPCFSQSAFCNTTADQIPNETGQIANLSILGSGSISANDNLVAVANSSPTRFGLLFQSTARETSPVSPTAGNGFFHGSICVGGSSNGSVVPVDRIAIAQADLTGVATVPLDFGAGGNAAGTMSGTTVHYQWFHRDINPSLNPAPPHGIGNFGGALSAVWMP